MISIGIAIILIGFVILALGTVLSALEGKTKGSVGGVIMIGPIPIIFGSDQKAVNLTIVLAIVLILLTFLLFYRVRF